MSQKNLKEDPDRPDIQVLVRRSEVAPADALAFLLDRHNLPQLCTWSPAELARIREEIPAKLEALRAERVTESQEEEERALHEGTRNPQR